MATHVIELQKLCKSQQRKIYAEKVPRITEVAHGILITKEGKQGLKQGMDCKKHQNVETLNGMTGRFRREGGGGGKVTVVTQAV